MDAANDYADEFMTNYNRRFAKAPRHDFDVHRTLETDDDLAASFTWREPRRVSKSLTVQYDKVLYLIEDNELNRRAIGKYIEVWHYPDGRKELRLNDAVLPYSTYCTVCVITRMSSCVASSREMSPRTAASDSESAAPVIARKAERGMGSPLLKGSSSCRQRAM